MTGYILAYVWHASKKAVTAFFLALLTSGGTAMLDGTLTGKEIIATVGGSLVAAALVYKAKNNPVDEGPDESGDDEHDSEEGVA